MIVYTSRSLGPVAAWSTATLPVLVPSHGERPHKNGLDDGSFNLLCGDFGRLRRFIRKQHERLVPARGDVEAVSERTVSNAHDLADFPHAAPPRATAILRAIDHDAVSAAFGRNAHRHRSFSSHS